MENKPMECSDSEEENNPSPIDNSKGNKRYAFLEGQVTPLLRAISMIELPDSEENSEQEDSEEEGSETEENRMKRATICSETGENRTKRVTICSETDKSRMKRAIIGSETETGDVQSWKELMQEEDEYEEQL